MLVLTMLCIALHSQEQLLRLVRCEGAFGLAVVVSLAIRVRVNILATHVGVQGRSKMHDGDEGNEAQERLAHTRATLRTARYDRLGNGLLERRPFGKARLFEGCGHDDDGRKQRTGWGKHLRFEVGKPAADGPAFHLDIMAGDPDETPAVQDHTSHASRDVVQTDAPAPVVSDASGRATLLDQARAFVRAPQVVNEGTDSKRSFLLNKGLTTEEAERVLAELVGLQPFLLY
jgi:hypothetical protein